MKRETSNCRLAWAVALCLVPALFLAGCTGGSWGMLKHNTRLMEALQAEDLPENYTYYYVGRANLPYAVVGIAPDYTFDSKFWFKIETREDLYAKIGRLSNLEAFHTRMYAKDIVSPSGRVMGNWFSYYNTTAVSVNEETQGVSVANPYKPGSRFRDH